MTDTLLIAATVSFLLAGTVKGLTGLGLPIVAVGVLAHFTDPRTAISLIIVPIFMSNIWQMRRQGNFIEALRNYWPLALTLTLILGVTVVGPHAAEILGQFTLARSNNMGLSALLRTVQPYPSYAEAPRKLAGLWRARQTRTWQTRLLARWFAIRR